MTDKLVENLFNYGVLGIVVVGMAMYIYFLHKQHSKERTEWRETAKEFNETTKQNIGLISRIEGMLLKRK